MGVTVGRMETLGWCDLVNSLLRAVGFALMLAGSRAVTERATPVATDGTAVGPASLDLRVCSACCTSHAPALYIFLCLLSCNQISVPTPPASCIFSNGSASAAFFTDDESETLPPKIPPT